MEYTAMEVQSVLRNYENLFAKRKTDRAKENAESGTRGIAVADSIKISKEGLDKLIKLQRIQAANAEEQQY
ncbi:MAG: hypothetical protein AAB300_00690 [Nitrospirota bacterium]